MKKYAMHSIPAAAALVAALVLGAQAQAQPATGAAPGSGMKQPVPELPSDNTTPPARTGAMPKDAQARTDAKAQKNPAQVAKKPAPELASDNTMPPAGTGAMPKETGGGSPKKTMP